MSKHAHGRFLSLIVVAATIATTEPTLWAVGAGKATPYRLAPPLRVAGRTVDETAAVGITQADPFLPRDPRKEPTTLAVEGYCLVSLRDHQRWVLGSPRVQLIWGGKLYLFSTPRARDIFLAAPELYLPVLDGDCLVSFAEGGERIAGKLEHGLVHGRRVYLFANQEKLQAFAKNPREYADVDLIDGGFCVVSKVNDRRHVAGIPETVAMVDGRRYFFASAFHRRLFVQHPERYVVRPLTNSQALAPLEVPAVSDVVALAGAGRSDSQRPSTDGSSHRFLRRHLEHTNQSASPENDALEESIHKRALAGYCPVTIRSQNLWRRGKSKFKVTFDGKIYFLNGPQELAEFQANPGYYAPVLSGDSVVALVNQYERVPGSVFHVTIYRDRMYLFATAEERDAFRDDPALYENADLAAEGNCMVSRRDDKREISGKAEFESLYLGKRYRFVSEAYLKKFEADPATYADL